MTIETKYDIGDSLLLCEKLALRKVKVVQIIITEDINSVYYKVVWNFGLGSRIVHEQFLIRQGGIVTHYL